MTTEILLMWAAVPVALFCLVGIPFGYNTRALRLSGMVATRAIACA